MSVDMSLLHVLIILILRVVLLLAGVVRTRCGECLRILILHRLRSKRLLRLLILRLVHLLLLVSILLLAEIRLVLALRCIYLTLNWIILVVARICWSWIVVETVRALVYRGSISVGICFHRYRIILKCIFFNIK